MNPYDDILHLPHPTSPRYPRMTMADRAAQFSPFAALTGYEAVIEETGRQTQRQIFLDENEKYILDCKQKLLMEHIHRQPEVTVCYYVPDERKDGGAYVHVSGQVKKVDTVERLLHLTDGTAIPLDHIIDLDSPLFRMH